jgi:predicted anti-sigma-YlaC factor YlaD
MSSDQHDTGALAGYVLGALDETDRRLVDDHLARCERCREEVHVLEETRTVLDAVPVEAFLDGPPDGDLVLQRALREVRRESARADLRRRGLIAAAAVVVAGAALAGGLLLGRGLNPPGQIAQPAPVTTAPAPQPTGVLVGSHTDPDTGARATVRVTPAAGWVRVNAAVTGIAAGQRCRLWVVARDGTRQLAGSWLVSAKGAQDGTALDGSALVAPADVAAVVIDNLDGRAFVSVPL